LATAPPPLPPLPAAAVTFTSRLTDNLINIKIFRFMRFSFSKLEGS
ncbi:7321_t:CDS:2, partial [Entrophospora sp. SA101]